MKKILVVLVLFLCVFLLDLIDFVVKMAKKAGVERSSI